MAYLIPEKRMNDYVSKHIDVQWALQWEANEVAVKAFQILKSSKQLDGLNDGGSVITVTAGDKVDWFVNLEDDEPIYNKKPEQDGPVPAGADRLSALAIEYGRAGYVDQFGVEYGEMRGLFALTRASGGTPTRTHSKRVRRPRKYSRKMLAALNSARQGGELRA